MSMEREIRSQFLKVIEQAEIAVGGRLNRFREAVFSFPSGEREGPQNPNFFLLPGLSGKAYWSLNELPPVVQDALSSVEEGFEQIRADYLAALPTMEFKSGLTGYFGHHTDWKHHDLVVKVVKVTLGTDQGHPTLLRFCQHLLREGYLEGCYFAVMSPGCHLKTHFGGFNHALRLHLGLIIPSGDCSLTVNGDARAWQAGGWLCFDDTFPHEAWNRTTSKRHILLARLLHPELSELERRAWYVMGGNALFWRTYTEFKKHYLRNDEEEKMTYKTFGECVAAAMKDTEILSGNGAAIFHIFDSYHYHPLNEQSLGYEGLWAVIERTGEPEGWVLIPQTPAAIPEKELFFSNPNNQTLFEAE